MENFDDLLVVDADGHVYEGNVDLASRMPEKWRSQAPVRLKDNEGNSRILLEGRLWSASQGLGPGVSGPMTEKARGYRAGMVDPQARLKDMDEEGIDVAILFGTQIALTVNGLMNKELAAVLCRAVNDWLIEYCSTNPQRLLAVGLIPCQDPPAAIKELEYLKKSRRGDGDASDQRLWLEQYGRPDVRSHLPMRPGDRDAAQRAPANRP